MYEFLERLIDIAIPRQRDFRGINPKSFDGRGNFAMGLEEQIVFPEIDYDKIDKIRGLNITIVTSARNSRPTASTTSSPPRRTTLITLIIQFNGGTGVD